MGNLMDSDEQYSDTCPRKAKLKETIKISPEQQQKLVHLIRNRGKSKSQYLLTAIDYSVSDPKQLQSAMLCQQFNQLTIYYEDFDQLLEDLRPSFPLKQVQIQSIILSVCEALQFMIDGPMKIRHGDICAKMICKKGNAWKLIDNSFIRQGITAYQKVLLGEDGFISPSQMDKIRHGFVRQSPALKQSDDVFALGMTCLQAMSGKPSKLCYKETYVRFNQKQIEQRLMKITSLYDPNLVQLVRKMINFNEQDRPKIKEILLHPNISKYGKKTSLKSYIRDSTRDSKTN